MKDGHDYKLIINWPEEENDYSYSFEVDYVEIILTSYQIGPEVKSET